MKFFEIMMCIFVVLICISMAAYFEYQLQNIMQKCEKPTIDYPEPSKISWRNV